MFIHVAKGRRSFRPLLRMLLSSPEQLIEEQFERVEVSIARADPRIPTIRLPTYGS